MDRQIEQKKGWRRAFTKKAVPIWAGVLIVAFVLFLIFRNQSNLLRTDRESATISDVTEGEFNDYIRVNGQVQPMITIQLSPQEGGVVQEILIEEGSEVNAGDPILVLSNDNLDLEILNSEAELAEKENILRNTMISMEQQKLSVRQDEMQLALDVKRNERSYGQQKSLYEDKLIARETYLKAQEDYDLSKQKYALVKERSVQDSLYRSVEIKQMNGSLDNMRLNMNMIRNRKNNLTIKSPIDGELGLLDVVLGQSVGAGAKIGQVNSLGSYKVEAQIDEHYIDRVVPGLEATFSRQEIGRAHV